MLGSFACCALDLGATQPRVPFALDPRPAPWVPYLQVVECRRILKWTYAYGFYSFRPVDELDAEAPSPASKEQQQFFEYNQARPPCALIPPSSDANKSIRWLCSRSDLCLQLL